MVKAGSKPRAKSQLARHLRHHVRFYVATAAGVFVGLAAIQAQPVGRLMFGGDAFFLLYLLLVAVMGLRLTPAGMRDRANFEDVGIAVVLAITVAAIAVSLTSIFALLRDGSKATSFELVLCVVSLLLGWLTLHTVFAFHYAHLFYRGKPGGGRRIDVGGLDFPGTSEPLPGDFLYFSFVVGMTAQVSDVQVRDGGMRRIVLVHGALSFFFNTILLALAINIAAGQMH